VPEDAQLSRLRFALADLLYGFVHSQELVVSGQDLLGLAAGFIEEDEVLQEVQEVLLLADALEQGLHVHRARLLLGQALPFVEVLPAAGDGSDLGLLPVAEHDYGVVVEEVGDGVQVVGEIALEGGLEALVDVLALYEKKRQAVDKSDDVRALVVEVALHPKLSHAEEVVVFRMVEVEEAQPLLLQLALPVLECHPHPLPHLVVLLPVGSGQGLGGGGGCDLANRLLVGGGGQVGVEFLQLGSQGADQDGLPVRGSAQQAVRAEVLLVESISGLPAQTMQVVGGGLLDQGAFGVLAHYCSTPLPICFSKA